MHDRNHASVRPHVSRTVWLAILVVAAALAFACCVGTSMLGMVTFARSASANHTVFVDGQRVAERATLTPAPTGAPAPDEALAFADRVLAILSPAEAAMETVQDDVQALANGRSTDVLGLYVDVRCARDRFAEAADALASLTPPTALGEARDELRAYAVDGRAACSALMKWLVGHEVADLAAYQSALEAASAHRAAGLAGIGAPAGSR